jgi:DNA replication protein DnaC
MADHNQQSTKLEEMIRGYTSNEVVLSPGYTEAEIDPSTLPPNKARLLGALGTRNIFLRRCSHCGSDTPGMPRLITVFWTGYRYEWAHDPIMPESYCCDSNKVAVAAIESLRATYANRVCDEVTAELMRDRVKGLVSESMIGDSWKERTFANFRISDRNRTAHDLCLAYAESFVKATAKRGRGIVLLGSVGTGKTHLAAAMTMRLLEQGVAVVWVNFVEMMGALSRRGGLEDYIDKLSGADILVIDDFGKEYNDSDEQEGIRIRQGLYRIVNNRAERKKPIIVTMNDTFDSLLKEKRMDPAVIDRLLGMCRDKDGKWNHVAKMDWNSERTGR